MKPAFRPIAAALLLAGCAADPGPATTGGKASAFSGDTSVANDANPNCRIVNTTAQRIRVGSNVPLHMVVVNTGNWCFSGFGLSGEDVSGSSLVNKPSDGEVRLLPRNGAFAYGYRPKPGFAGSDDFLIAMPTGFGYEINLAVSVTVKPGH